MFFSVKNPAKVSNLTVDQALAMGNYDITGIDQIAPAHLDVTFTDVAASRALETSYQNGADGARLVIIACESDGNKYWQAQISPDNSNWYAVTRLDSPASTATEGYTFIVPKSFYYRLHEMSAGTDPVIGKWWEWG